MPRNTEQTKAKLKAAAVAEFAEFGLHGTTTEKIAARAGINKERLYNYFGDKSKLFATVLSEELAKVAAAVPITSLQDEDVGEYAGRVFDYHEANPHLMRLLQWEALAYGEREIPDEVARTDYYQSKVHAFQAGQRAGDVTREADASDLLFLTLALAQWWHALPQLARMITGVGQPKQSDIARRRAAIVEAARRMAAPQPQHSPDPRPSSS